MKTNGKINEKAIRSINVMTDRVRKLKETWENAEPVVCPEASILFTKSWKETEGEPLDVKWAKAFAARMKELPIAIRDGELIVGSLTPYPKGVYFITALGPKRIADMVSKLQFERRQSATSFAKIDETSAKVLMEDAQYWIDHTPPDYITTALREEFGEEHFDLYQDRAMVFEGMFLKADVQRGLFQDYHGYWNGFPHPRFSVVKKGLNGIIELAKAEIEKMQKETPKLPYTSSAGWRKLCFLRSIIISLEALITFAKRHADLARTLAEKENDPARKKELLKIADVCEWVPANPPRDFREAIQSLRFVHLSYRAEMPGRGENALGNIQNYYPYLQKDLKEGKITLQEAGELLACLFIKTREAEIVESITEWIAPGTLMTNITIGGKDDRGKDLTNELSWLTLKVMADLKLSEPPVYIRYHNDMNKDFIKFALECNKEYGGGNPAFLNDGLGVARFTDRGVKLKDAVNWEASGCLGYHLDCAEHNAGMMHLNQAKIFELTLYNGFDPRTGKQLGLKTGDVTKFASINQFYDAFYKQVDHFADLLRRDYFIRRSVDLEHAPQSGLDGAMFFEYTIKSGLMSLRGGGKYPALDSMEWVGDRGITDVANSVAAIQHLVFEKKKITMGQLLEALKADWEGKEDLRQMFLKAPKYGNDDDYADDIFNRISLKVQEIMLSRPDPFTGLKPYLFKGAAMGHVIHGRVVGALPCGRKAYTPVTDGATSAMPGTDVKGPTALINSATKVDHMRQLRGGTHNMKFSKQLMNTPEKLEKVNTLVKTFFDRGGWHIQFNIVSQDELREARVHPENWKSLLIRVGGYSAYFVDLPPSLQDEIIARSVY